MENKITTRKLLDMKKAGEKIAVLTGYDCTMAKILNEAGVDVLLVGDSVGMVKLGYDNTLPVTLDDILYHCRAVRRGNSRALLIGDMPFMTYQTTIEDAVANAGKLVKWGGVEGVKVEGGVEIIDKIRALLDAKIPVMGHLGMTPQSIHQLGGYRFQGKNDRSAQEMIDAAKALEKAGVFAIVLECIPAPLAREITAKASIPTIGIGAGPDCDGQVVVVDDMLGLYSEFKPKFVKRYANLRPQMIEAIKLYCREVKDGAFPSEEQTYK